MQPSMQNRVPSQFTRLPMHNFFFFQAEDGIRDKLVTGVQTCALPISLNLFLRYRYTPSPYTLFKDVRKLAAGTMLKFEKGTHCLRRWYKYKPTPFSPMRSFDEAQEELLELYKRSVKRQLLSDVPPGLLLSGGVDSGLLLALMNLYGESWRTYTVGYGSGFFDDELTDAADTAARFSFEKTHGKLEKNPFLGALPKNFSSLAKHLELS